MSEKGSSLPDSQSGTKPVAPSADSHSDHQHQSFWLWVVCLIGVDYFSTLAYQPSIAFASSGRLAPISTLFLVLMTLGGALPVYYYVADKSPKGQGSLAMLQRLLHGWSAKFLVLVLLGFAATDFVITMTLSSADAAAHVIHNPVWDHAPQFLHNQVGLTLFILITLGAIFMRGMKEAIGVAVVIVTVYLSLNFLLIGTALLEIAQNPVHLTNWWNHILEGDLAIPETSAQPRSFAMLFFLAALYFPKLILGLSGFETGVAVMPLIKGDPDDDPEYPKGRIRNARKLLITAACTMSIFLLGSSIVVSMLIPPEALQEGGPAADRALAYLAHGEGDAPIAWWCGEVFGTIYDISTVVILSFAGASALSGLLNLIPRFLPNYGMAPAWAAAVRPLVLVIMTISVIVTLIFQADVAAQGAAYATGVMVLILAGCIAVAIDRYRNRTTKSWLTIPWGTIFISIVFAVCTTDIIIEKPDGLMIASFFIAGILIVSITSRIVRSAELRFVEFEFADNESQFLWQSLQHLEVPVLAPHRPGGRSLAEKERELRDWHHIPDDVPVVFVEVNLGDPSDFYQSPRIKIHSEKGIFIIKVDRCTATAPALAAITIALSHPGNPIELHFGWSDESPMRTNLGFLLFGEGNIPWLVRDLIRRIEPDEKMRPRIIIG